MELLLVHVDELPIRPVSLLRELQERLAARVEIPFAHPLENQRVRPHCGTHLGPFTLLQRVQSEPQVPHEPALRVGVDHAAVGHEVGPDSVPPHVLDAQMEVPHHRHPRERERSDIKRRQVRHDPGPDHPKKLPL